MGAADLDRLIVTEGRLGREAMASAHPEAADVIGREAAAGYHLAAAERVELAVDACARAVWRSEAKAALVSPRGPAGACAPLNHVGGHLTARPCAESARARLGSGAPDRESSALGEIGASVDSGG